MLMEFCFKLYAKEDPNEVSDDKYETLVGSTILVVCFSICVEHIEQNVGVIFKLYLYMYQDDMSVIGIILIITSICYI